MKFTKEQKQYLWDNLHHLNNAVIDRFIVYLSEEENLIKHNNDFMAQNYEINTYNSFSLPHISPKSAQIFYICPKCKGNWKNGIYEKFIIRLKTNSPAKYCKNPSKPQLILFQKVQDKYGEGNVFINYPVSMGGGVGGTYYLDVAVPTKMLNYEYDAEFWHNLHEKNYPKYHEKRDTYLSDIGWKIIRIKGDKNTKDINIDTL
ncbi:MAG: hypothetical protein AABY22_27550 [Nanoarchaeota archaeon]